MPIVVLVAWVGYVRAENIQCSPEGYTVLYINGIFTEQESAETNLDELRRVFYQKAKASLVTETEIKNAYNPTHIAGLGDVVKAVVQKIRETGTPFEDYDLMEMVRRLEGEVQTQKILIVGHSQGTFYANALYAYLISKGVPAESVAVFNIAAPVGSTPGGGKHLTNTNDALVEAVRTTTKLFGYTEPLPANIDIPLAEGDMGLFAGHSLAGVYLVKRPTRISGDIEILLSKLKSDPTRDPRLPCVPPPTLGVTHTAKGLALFAGDMAGGAYTLVRENATAPVLDTTTHLAESLGTTLARVLGTRRVVASAAAALPPTTVTPETFEIHEFPEAPFAVTTEVPLGTYRLQEPAEVVSNELLSQEAVVIEQPVPESVLAPHISEPVAVAPTPPPLGFGGLLTLDPGFGGGSGGSTSASTPQPTVPTIALTVSTVDSVLATTTVTLEGTAEVDAIVTSDDGVTSATTTADQSGNWRVEYVRTEGVHTFTISAANASGGTSSIHTRTITIDLTPPQTPTLTVPLCAVSLSTEVCLVATTTVPLTWTQISDAVSYTVDTHTTADTAYMATLTPNATTTLTVIARDAAGNSATSSPVSVIVIPQPIIINEIAWSGTKANPEDEWIELKNISGYALSLDAVHLMNTTGTRDTTLSGIVSAQNTTDNTDLYLIERRTDATTADHSHITLFPLLDDAGEAVQLVHEGTVLDQTPAVDTCGGWCAGSLTTAVRFSETHGTYETTRSMERSSVASGLFSSSWHPNDGYTKSAGDIGGNEVYGTPKTENSTALPSVGWYCEPDTDSISDGQQYTPQTTGCVYLSGFIHTNARRWGAVYKGVPGNAAEVSAHSLGKGMQSLENFPAWAFSNGDTFFVALWESRTTGNDVADFNNWFLYGTTTTGATEAPHTNYRMVEWVWGE